MEGMEGLIKYLEDMRRKHNEEVDFYKTQVIEYVPFQYNNKSYSQWTCSHCSGSNSYRKVKCKHCLTPTKVKINDNHLVRANHLEYMIVFQNLPEMSIFYNFLVSLKFKPVWCGNMLFCKMKRYHSKGHEKDNSNVKDEICRFLTMTHSTKNYPHEIYERYIKFTHEVFSHESLSDDYLRYLLTINEKRSCSVLATSIVTGLFVEEVNAYYTQLGYRENKSGAYTSHILDVIDKLGYNTKKFTYKSKTVRTLERELPKDKVFLIFVSRHVLAYRYGKIQDWTQNKLNRIESVYEVTERSGGFTFPEK